MQIEFGNARKERYVDETYVNGELQESDESNESDDVTDSESE